MVSSEAVMLEYEGSIVMMYNVNQDHDFIIAWIVRNLSCTVENIFNKSLNHTLKLSPSYMRQYLKYMIKMYAAYRNVWEKTCN